MCAVAFGQMEGDSLAVSPDSSLHVALDSLSVPDTVSLDIVVDWEAQWAEWCATAHCVSSDTSLWNVPDVGLTRVGEHLDSAFVAERLTALNVLSELDLRWNPVAHRRIVTYGKRRTHHLGTMLGRSAMYFPLFEEVLAREGCHSS